MSSFSSDKTLSARPLGEPTSRTVDGPTYARKMDARSGATKPFKQEEEPSPKPGTPGYPGGVIPKFHGI